MTNLDPESLKELFRAELARRGLLDFASLVYPKFEAPKHVEFLAGLLEKVEAGGINRLAISCPPGHGKSTLLNLFVSFFLGRDPARRILAISANESLAKRNSRQIQGLVTGDNYPFPGVQLANDSVLEWSTNSGGSVRAIGRSGVISGFRAELILLDDLQPDAGSESTRQSDLEFFKEVVSTRLEPGGAAIIIQTRWHDGDLIGALAEGDSSGDWLFVNLPALALSNDILGRAEGEVLWPQRWPLSALLSKQTEIGSGPFAALYQGDPVVEGGSLFKIPWLQNYFDRLPAGRAILPNPDLRQRLLEDAEVASGARPARRSEPLYCLQACDSAWKAGIQNDRSAIITVASDGRDFFVIDCWVGKLEFTDLTEKLKEQYVKHKPRIAYVEAASSGFALVDTLKRTTGIPIKEVPPGRESKIAKYESVLNVFEAGRVKFPRNASWLPELIHELSRCPHGRYDDQADALVLAIRMMQETIRRGNKYRADRAIEARLQHWMTR